MTSLETYVKDLGFGHVLVTVILEKSSLNYSVYSDIFMK